MTQDIKERIKKSFYECFRCLRAAEFIGSDWRTGMAKDSVTYAIKEAEENFGNAMQEVEELKEREEKLVSLVKFLRSSVKCNSAMDDILDKSFAELGINPTNGE